MITIIILLICVIKVVSICYMFQPFARLGAEVTGIDASAELIQAAKWHADLDSGIKNRLTYKMSTVEDLSSSLTADVHPSLYDGVIASEIVEHVADAELFVNACCSLVKVTMFDQALHG